MGLVLISWVEPKVNGLDLVRPKVNGLDLGSGFDSNKLGWTKGKWVGPRKWAWS